MLWSIFNLVFSSSSLSGLYTDTSYSNQIGMNLLIIPIAVLFRITMKYLQILFCSKMEKTCSPLPYSCTSYVLVPFISARFDISLSLYFFSYILQLFMTWINFLQRRAGYNYQEFNFQDHWPVVIQLVCFQSENIAQKTV